MIAKLAGTGANGIYIQSIRSHGGDGAADHNPFVDSDPSNSVSEAIFAQWDGWFRAMDAASIVVYLFVYDDSTCIWGCGSPRVDDVPAEEEAYLRALVNRFEDIGHLVWIIAEEYAERYSAARMSNIAAVIREADDFDHPIGVHKNAGNRFDEFTGDPSIDQFTMQTNAANVDELHANALDAVTRAAGDFNVNVAEAAVGGGGHGEGAAGRRHNWAIAMAGAYIMAFEWDIASTAVSDLEQCGHLVRFMEGSRFDRMAPDDARAIGETSYVLSESPSTFILYAASGTGDLGARDVAAGTYTLSWLGAVSGTTVEQADVVVAGGDTLFTPPSSPSLGAEVAVYVRPTPVGEPDAQRTFTDINLTGFAPAVIPRARGSRMDSLG